MACARRARGLSASLVLIATALPALAHATMAFTVLRNGQWQVAISEHPGAEVRYLPLEPGVDAGEVAIHPQGNAVAYGTTDGRVVTCSLGEVSDCRRTDGTAQLARPAWFPSGELLAVRFAVDTTNEDSDLWRQQDGSWVPLLLQTGVQEDPDVHPSGKEIVYTSAQTVSMRRAGVRVVQHLWLLDLGTGQARPLLLSHARDTQPTWSPSGERIAFSSNRSGQFEIWIVNRDGTDLRQLTHADGVKTAPVWSPDGQTILFTLAADGRYSLWQVGADGRGQLPLRERGDNHGLQARDADWK